MNVEKKIVPFDKSAAYLHHRAMKNRRDNNHVDALELLRSAVETSPDNMQYRLDLARMYSEMGCHEQSNRLLLDMLSDENAPRECYYGLAMNLLAMHDVDGARRAMADYKSRAGELPEDGEPEMYFYEAMLRPATRRGQRAVRISDMACDRMKSEDFSEAARLFEQSLRLDPSRMEMRALYGMDLMLMGKHAEAILETERALREAGDHHEASARTMCVAAQTYQMAKMDNVAKEIILKAVELRPSGMERKMLLFALGEMELHKEAAECARLGLAETPHDRQLLHIRAVALLKSGTPAKDTEKFWARILRIDPEDSIARYYQEAALTGELTPEKVGYVYRVPHEEAIRRLKYVSEIIAIKMGDVDAVWKNDAYFRSILKWCAGVENEQFRRAAVTILAALDDEEALSMLRAMLADHTMPYALKQHAAALLKLRGVDSKKILPSGMDAKEGVLPDPEVILQNMPVGVRQAARFADEVLESDYSMSALSAIAIMLIRCYVRYPELSRSREKINPIAAAAVYLYLDQRGLKPKFMTVSRQFGCSMRRLVYYVTRFTAVLEEEKANENR